jgi:hypothetical protein
MPGTNPKGIPKENLADETAVTAAAPTMKFLRVTGIAPPTQSTLPAV